MKRAFATITLAIVFAAIGSPRGVLAEKLHLQASFTVAFAATANSPPVAYCGGPALDYKVEGTATVTHRSAPWSSSSKRRSAGPMGTGASL
jgi:hypothetical protein